jgi:hypothetical protein
MAGGLIVGAILAAGAGIFVVKRRKAEEENSMEARAIAYIGDNYDDVTFGPIVKIEIKNEQEIAPGHFVAEVWITFKDGNVEPGFLIHNDNGHWYGTGDNPGEQWDL